MAISYVCPTLHAESGAHRLDELLIRVSDVMRALLPHASMEAVHDALLTLNKNGLIELRPTGGSEFLRPEDAAVCPRGPRETVFAYAYGATWRGEPEETRLFSPSPRSIAKQCGVGEGVRG